MFQNFLITLFSFKNLQPKMAFNLPSHSLCFSDLATERTIGTVKEQKRLYCHKDLGTKDSISRQTTTSSLYLNYFWVLSNLISPSSRTSILLCLKVYVPLFILQRVCWIIHMWYMSICKITTMPHIFLVIQKKVFILLILFTHIFKHLHQTLCIQCQVVCHFYWWLCPCYMDFSHERKILNFYFICQILL